MKKHLVWLAAEVLPFTACQAKDLTAPVVSSASAMLLLPMESLVILASLAITLIATTLITTRLIALR